jgi:hypothetical protein
MEGPAFREFADKVHSRSICVEQEPLDGYFEIKRVQLQGSQK